MSNSNFHTISTRADSAREEAKSLANSNIEIKGSGVMSKKSCLIVQSDEAKKQVRAFLEIRHKK